MFSKTELAYGSIHLPAQARSIFAPAKRPRVFPSTTTPQDTNQAGLWSGQVWGVGAGSESGRWSPFAEAENIVPVGEMMPYVQSGDVQPPPPSSKQLQFMWAHDQVSCPRGQIYRGWSELPGTKDGSEGYERRSLRRCGACAARGRHKTALPIALVVVWSLQPTRERVVTLVGNIGTYICFLFIHNGVYFPGERGSDLLFFRK